MKKQKGFALLFVLVIVVLAASYAFVNQLSAASGFTAARRDHNARILSQAKHALVGYVAMRAGQTGENDPGSLPCPEAAGNYGNPALEGIAAGNCAVPAAGRLPWRTLGVDQLTDAHGEPLWYVVSPGWHKPNSTTNTVINSNSIGQLAVDGVANDAVALIIAPGAPLISNAAGCAGVTQTRNTASANLVDYLDCDNATAGDSSFATRGPDSSFNDQVLRITARDIVPAIEAGIAPRIEREIVPALRSVYASSAWGANVSAANPFYPYAAGPFANPALGASFRGSPGSCPGTTGGACQGLLPAVFINDPAASGLCAAAAGWACEPNFVRWTSGTIEVSEWTADGTVYNTGTIVSGVLTWSLTTTNCTVGTVNAATPREHTELRCNARVPAISSYASNNVRYRVRGNAANVGMVFREFDTANSMPGVTIQTAPSATVNSAGAAATTFEARMDVPGGAGSLVSLGLCGLNVSGALTGILSGLECRQISVTVPITLFGDAPVVNARHPDLGWFARNEWYRVLYYVAALEATPGRSASTPGCSTGGNCLEFPLGGVNQNKRALLFLAGRSLQGTLGHSRTLNDFLDIAANRDGGKRFETRPITTVYNDRAMVVQVDP